MNLPQLTSREWLESDGHGGFASGTASGIRTRRYHALLLSARTPPTGRMVLVNGLDAWVETTAGRFFLSSQQYAPDVLADEGARRIESFTAEPFPRWVFALPDGTKIEQIILLGRDAGATVVRWRLLNRREVLRFVVRPFLSGRDYHALHRENGAFRFEAQMEGERITWRPYDGVPGIVALTNGTYQHDPAWYRHFRYAEETSRGLDDTEDLAAPGSFEFELNGAPAVLVLATHDSPAWSRKRDLSAVRFGDAIIANETLRRAEFPTPLHRAGDAYLVTGRNGKTIIAGYPWFTDWGRDTFIALRGLCLATGRFAEAREILLNWSRCVSQGMLPNYFPDQGQPPEYNSVDASLWFVIAAHELLRAADGQTDLLSISDRQTLQHAIEAILEGYSGGTRYGIRMDDDGLLACGMPGVQLTWMDAKVGDWVVTPRIGKPVEVQALWLNALKIASEFSPGWQNHFTRGRDSFQRKFWNEAKQCLFDVVDVDHVPDRKDAEVRPNQIFAVGGLPFRLVEGPRANRIVECVETQLWTPLGLRSLSRDSASYAPRYEGGIRTRDGAYHQGTVWPWLLGAFVEAWLQVQGDDAVHRKLARRKFLSPLREHLDEAGLGHVSEIADGAPPHTARGCPFQAWSVGELLRLELKILTATAATRPKTKRIARIS